jgi:hypothetical protein
LDKWQAQQQFWEGFGLTAYDERTVPDGATMPYITYEAVSGNLGAQTTISVSLWYRSNSWAEISQKAEEIARKIYEDPRPALQIDEGYIMVRLPNGTMHSNRMDEPNDKQVRRIRFVVEVEFLTAY